MLGQKVFPRVSTAILSISGVGSTVNVHQRPRPVIPDRMPRMLTPASSQCGPFYRVSVSLKWAWLHYAAYRLQLNAFPWSNSVSLSYPHPPSSTHYLLSRPIMYKFTQLWSNRYLLEMCSSSGSPDSSSSLTQFITSLLASRVLWASATILLIWFLGWRLWRFHLVPALWPHEPKPLPYWVPLIGTRTQEACLKMSAYFADRS